MPQLDFTEAIMEARRRAELQGRPLSQQEMEGIASGAATTAQERLSRSKALALQEQELGMRGEQFQAQMEEARAAREQRSREFADEMEQRRREFQAQMQSARDAMDAGNRNAWISAGGYVVGSMCIIISSCTDPHSYEVEIAREYRDKYLDKDTLNGYYALASIVAPQIRKHNWLKKVMFKGLVKPLVDYGEFRLGYKPEQPKAWSWATTWAFLGLCKVVGVFAPERKEVAV